CTQAADLLEDENHAFFQGKGRVVDQRCRGRPCFQEEIVGPPAVNGDFAMRLVQWQCVQGFEHLCVAVRQGLQDAGGFDMSGERTATQHPTSRGQYLAVGATPDAQREVDPAVAAIMDGVVQQACMAAQGYASPG